MTEDEAKTRWCPFPRMGAFHGIGGSPGGVAGTLGGVQQMQLVPMTANRTSEAKPLDGSCCMGSACMAWRYEGDRRNGWCGLAGSIK